MLNGLTFKNMVIREAAKRGLSPADLARKCKRNENWIHDFAKSDTVRPLTVARVAKALKIDPEYFFAQADK